MKTFTLLSFVLGLVLTAASAAPVSAEDWMNWRGPNLTGVATKGEKYPTQWGEDKNIAWKKEIPGSGSTPIVFGERIILTSVKDGKNAVYCLNRNGDIQWIKTLGEATKGKHKKATGSNSSPVTDGKLIYVYFKSGELATLKLNGDVVWKKNLQEDYGKDTLWWDLGTSPILTSKYLVVACMHDTPSYLAAFEKETGKVAWKVDRNTSAPVEAKHSYTTPILVKQQGKESIVVLGADYVTSHDAEDGKENWRVGSLNPTNNGYFRSISSPVQAGNMIIAPYARGGSLTAVKLGGSGDVTKSHVPWSIKNISSDVPTPAAVGDRVFVLIDGKKNKGSIVCLNATNGKTVWSERVGDRRAPHFTSSPVIAGGNIYALAENGITYVASASDDYKFVAANKLETDGVVVCTPVCVDGKILIRTPGHLYCIGK